MLKHYLRRPFWAAANDLLVVVDEVALPVGRYRIRAGAAPAATTGSRASKRHSADQEYPRLRIGVGPSEERKNVYRRISPISCSRRSRATSAEDIIALMPKFEAAIRSCGCARDVDRAMNAYNRDATGRGE